MAHYIDYQQTDGSTPVATLNRVGSVKPDGTSINISPDGTINCNGKLDLDVNNATSTTKETVVGWGVPNFNAGLDVTSSTHVSSGIGYRPSKDGILVIMGRNNNGNCSLIIYDNNGNLIFNSVINNTSGNSGTAVVFSVSKNYSYRVWQYSSNASIIYFPYKGA